MENKLFKSLVNIFKGVDDNLPKNSIRDNNVDDLIQKRLQSREHFEAGEGYLYNKYINTWWGQKHDELLEATVKEYQWIWADTNIVDKIVEITLERQIEKWKTSDPLVAQYAWYNILLYYAVSRAECLKLKRLIRKPQIKKCLCCGYDFIEDSLHYSFLKQSGTDYDKINICGVCLEEAIWSEGKENYSERELAQWIVSLAELLSKIPMQIDAIGNNGSICLYPQVQQGNIISHLKRKPSIKSIKKVYGSWFEALLKTGVIEGDSLKTSRGIKTIANDGHVCLSLGERTICDFLYENGISHRKETHYPDSNYRADFEVDGIFIEYFGLAGNPEYDKKTEIKQVLAKKYGIKLISIYPKDVAAPGNLKRKFRKIFKNRNE